MHRTEIAAGEALLDSRLGKGWSTKIRLFSLKHILYMFFFRFSVFTCVSSCLALLCVHVHARSPLCPMVIRPGNNQSTIFRWFSFQTWGFPVCHVWSRNWYAPFLQKYVFSYSTKLRFIFWGLSCGLSRRNPTATRPRRQLDSHMQELPSGCNQVCAVFGRMTGWWVKKGFLLGIMTLTLICSHDTRLKELH